MRNAARLARYENRPYRTIAGMSVFSEHGEFGEQVVELKDEADLTIAVPVEREFDASEPPPAIWMSPNEMKGNPRASSPVGCVRAVEPAQEVQRALAAPSIDRAPRQTRRA